MPSSIEHESALPQPKLPNRPQRVRTADQLLRKRQDDRISKKNQRAENKLRMERLEDDVKYIKQRVTAWDSLLQCSALGTVQMVRHLPIEHLAVRLGKLVPRFITQELSTFGYLIQPLLGLQNHIW